MEFSVSVKLDNGCYTVKIKAVDGTIVYELPKDKGREVTLIIEACSSLLQISISSMAVWLFEELGVRPL